MILPVILVMVFAFAAIIGMQMSLRCKRTVMAVMSSVGIVAGACGALGLCGAGAIDQKNLEKLGLGIGAFSPFTLLSMLINPLEAAGKSFGDTSADMIEARLWIFMGSFLAAGAYAAVVWAMYASMVKNFDMTIRKQAS